MMSTDCLQHFGANQNCRLCNNSDPKIFFGEVYPKKKKLPPLRVVYGRMTVEKKKDNKKQASVINVGHGNTHFKSEISERLN